MKTAAYKARQLLVRTFTSLALACGGVAANATPVVSYHQISVDGIRIFYREAGDPAKPTMLLLHGFPSSSHMFRDLIPLLADNFHLIAPDYPGAGYSDVPTEQKFVPTFDHLADLVEKFVLQQSPKPHLILYMQDFGGPVGLRLATRHPEWINGLIIQNSPVSLTGWDAARLKSVQDAATLPLAQAKEAAAARVTAATAQYMYQKGARNPAGLNPDAWVTDAYALSNPEVKRVMSEFLLDIPANIALYPAWQTYLHQYQPLTLVVWGTGDPIFSPNGATDIKQIIPSAEVHLYNSGHFALEEDNVDIAQQIGHVFSHVSP